MHENTLLLSVHDNDEALPFGQLLTPCSITEFMHLLHDNLAFMPDTMHQAPVSAMPVVLELVGFTLRDDELCVLHPKDDVESAGLTSYVYMKDYTIGLAPVAQPEIMLIQDALRRVAFEQTSFRVRLTDDERLYEPVELDKINIYANAQVSTLGVFERVCNEEQTELVILVGVMIPRALIEGHSHLTYRDHPDNEVVATQVSQLGIDPKLQTGVNYLLDYFQRDQIIDPAAWWLGLQDAQEEGNDERD